MSYELIFECIALAVGAGLIYGIFGGGSGLVLMPGFYYVVRHFDLAVDHRMQIAIATTAAVSAFMGTLSIRVQWQAGNIDAAVIKRVLPGITVGMLAAVWLLNIIPSDILKHVFGFVVILVAAWLWIYNQDKDLKSWSLQGIKNQFYSFLIGLLWFLLGIAVFTVPYLHKCRVNMHHAVGSATLISTVLSVSGGILLMLTGSYVIGVSKTHIGYVNLVLLVSAVIPGILAGYFGSKISTKIEKKRLKKYYAGLIFVVGALMII